MVPFLFDGHEFLLTRDGALFWPEHSALLVADLHLEKASFFARWGQMLPPYDSMETLIRLEHVAETCGAQAIWCLGDSFHDDGGFARLPADARGKLEAMAARMDWVWIVGNHDAGGGMPVGRVVAELSVAGVTLRHEAEADDPTPEISGHYHPKLMLRHRGQNVSRRCYLANARKLILPAFGALTGGLDVRHPAIRAAMGPEATALIATQERLMRFAVV